MQHQLIPSLQAHRSTRSPRHTHRSTPTLHSSNPNTHIPHMHVCFVFMCVGTWTGPMAVSSEMVVMVEAASQVTKPTSKRARPTHLGPLNLFLATTMSLPDYLPHIPTTSLKYVTVLPLSMSFRILAVCLRILVRERGSRRRLNMVWRWSSIASVVSRLVTLVWKAHLFYSCIASMTRAVIIE